MAFLIVFHHESESGAWLTSTKRVSAWATVASPATQPETQITASSLSSRSDRSNMISLFMAFSERRERERVATVSSPIGDCKLPSAKTSLFDDRDAVAREPGGP